MVLKSRRDLMNTERSCLSMQPCNTHTSILLPIEELVKMCREAGFKRIFVDGCHELGTVADLNVQAIGAVFMLET